jgi:rhodanese-related sulfurtransferase
VPPADDRAAVAAIPRISVSETEALVKSGAAILLDVRPEPAFRSERIKGAISMPPAQITARYKSLPADKKIITYCA